MQTTTLGALLATFTLSATASAQFPPLPDRIRSETVTVTISADTVDVDPWTATIDDLPGPDGEVSFAEAIITTNNTPGPQRIAFAIPQSDWQFQWLYPGRAVLRTSGGMGVRASDEVTIDGTTQTAFTGDTNPDGNEVLLWGSALYLNADNCTLMGFDTSSVSATADRARIEGNTQVNIDLFSGSNSLVRGNTGGTIKIDRSDRNRIVGNTVQRVRIWLATGNRIGGPELADRNFITGYGTWNSEGLPSGTTVQLFETTDTVIENNYIGTTPDGLEQGSLASNIGIGFEGSNSGTRVKDNLIAGILGHGQGPHHQGQLFGWAVLFWQLGDGDDVSFTGNTIGLDANGEPRLGSVWGIDVGNAGASGIVDVRIGGTAPGEGNVIAGHRLNGITVGRSTPNVRISGNSLHTNGWLGIDLIPTGYGYGVSFNDALDADTGGNGLQNFPEVTSATVEGNAIRVVGELHSSAFADLTIELFASPACDDSGYGEGEVFLGATQVSTDAAGNASFDVQVPARVPPGWLLTSTATLEPTGATSEFSACIPIGGVLGLDD